MDSVAQENDAKTAKSLLKRPVLMASISEDETNYFSLLMPEPCKQIEIELKYTKSIQLMSSDNNRKECLLKEKNIVLKVSPDSCECNFRTSWMLPCRHIFFARNLFGISAFSQDLCDKRWTKAHVLQNHPRYRTGRATVGQINDIVPVVTTSAKKLNPTSVNEKRKI